MPSIAGSCRCCVERQSLSRRVCGDRDGAERGTREWCGGAISLKGDVGGNGRKLLVTEREPRAPEQKLGKHPVEAVDEERAQRVYRYGRDDGGCFCKSSQGRAPINVLACPSWQVHILGTSRGTYSGGRSPVLYRTMVGPRVEKV